ncbi:MAG: WbqC family protein [Rhodospirillales bacterium]|nr:WbqC family protein [Rhodospirillales bacterium]
MILTAHQPVYLPWLGLFHKIALADRFISFNQVQYQAKDWNNRNKIKTPQGPIWMTVPVLRKGRLEKSYQDIEINNSINWGRKHWQAMRLNYAKAPFFGKYADYFEDIYAREWRTLMELNETMLQWFVDTLGIDIKIESAGDFDFQGTKGDLVADMCRKTGATTYIFGVQGRDYADIAAFESAGVKLYFQDYTHPEYPQLSETFEPYMSIVDLLFNCGEGSLDILMSGNLGRSELKEMVQ